MRAWAGAAVSLLTAAASAAPVLHVSRDSVDFGAHAHIARPQTFVVTNLGTEPWRVPALAVEGPDALAFSIASRACPAETLVPPHGRCIFEVGFVPIGHGGQRAGVRIAPDRAVALRGIAVARRADGLGPIAMIFSRGVDLAYPLSETIEISNAGDEPLRITGLLIDGAQPAEFEIASACALPASLDIGEACWITISMTGAGTAPWSAELVVEAAGLGVYRVGVTGYEPPAPPPLVP